MVGRKVRIPHHRQQGEVVKWEPLGAAMCDALVRHDDGTECWYGSGDLQPDDGRGPLPSRREARELAKRETVASLEAIRAKHIAEWGKPWPGAEHGKALVGMMIDGALKKVREE